MNSLFRSFSAIIIVLTINLNAFGQCNVNIMASDTIVCLGDSTILFANIDCGNIYFDGFNTGQCDSMLIPDTNFCFTNPCVSGPDGSTCLWMDSSVISPRFLESKPFKIDSGTTLSFDFIYAVHSFPSPCEGPDMLNEGMTVQFSVDSGNTWIDLVYFQPDGSILQSNPDSSVLCYPCLGGYTLFNNWFSYTINLPTEANTSNTKFRWIQEKWIPKVNDHWGLDNICIHNSNYQNFNWLHNGDSTQSPPPVYPTQDTMYIVEVIDVVSGLLCSDTIYIYVEDVDTSITVTNSSLTANESNGTYQWLYCSPFQSVPGETSQVFTPLVSGIYACDITSQHGCNAISSCIYFQFDNISEPNHLNLYMYPNPTNNILFIESEEIIQQIQILDLSSRVMYSDMPESSELSIDVYSMPDGEYIINIEFEDGVVNRRFTKITK